MVISIHRTGDGFQPGLFKYYVTGKKLANDKVKDCRITARIAISV